MISSESTPPAQPLTQATAGVAFVQPRRRSAAYSRVRMATWVLLADGIGIVATVWIGALMVPATTAWSWWVGAAVMPIIAYVLGGYSFPGRSLPQVVMAVAISGLIVAVAASVWSNRLDLGLLWLAGLGGWPMAMRLVLGRRLIAHAGRARWLAIGPRADLDGLRTDHRQGQFTGDLRLFATDAATPDTGEGTEGDGFLTSSVDVAAVLQEHWSGVIVAGTTDRLAPALVTSLMAARVSGLRVYDLGDFSERFTGRVPTYHLHDGWVAVAHGFDLLHDPFSLRLKRLSDMCTASLILMITLPLILLTAIAVRVTSRGPILFRQSRIGLNGVPFQVYKFRTMYVGSEAGDRYTQIGDRRITRIGGLLRRTRLDELPQLWNVLAGDMSLVGPRAEWDVLVQDYAQQIPYYQMRHLVRPGLTGWAQVNYPYGASVEDARRKLEYDLYYIKRFSLLLDLRILLKTCRVVLFGAGR